MCSAGADQRRRAPRRASSRSSSIRSKYALPPRPSREVASSCSCDGLDGRAGERAERAGVQVRDARAPGTARGLLERHPIVELDRRVVGQQPRRRARRRSVGHTSGADVLRPRTRTWSMLAGPSARGARCCSSPQVEVAGEHATPARARPIGLDQRVQRSRCSCGARYSRHARELARRVDVADDDVARAGRRGRPRRSRRCVADLSVRCSSGTRAAARARIAFAWPVTPSGRQPWLYRGQRRRRATARTARPLRDRARDGHPAPAWSGRAPRPAPPGGRRRRVVGGGELDHLARGARAARRQGVAVEEVPGADEHGSPRLAYVACASSLADPPAFTPQYDHELAAALARAGADVELATSRFRFGERPAPGRLPAARALLPALVAALPPLAPAPAAEGRSSTVRPGAARARTPADVLHVQWLAVPELDVAPAAPPCAARCFTAHDLLPRRTAASRISGAGCSAASTASSCTASAAARRWPSSASDATRVIPHPVFPSDPRARTTAARCSRSASIRPYKGLRRDRGARRSDARLLVAGDPRCRSTVRGATRRVAARLPAAGGARPRARRGDRRRLPVPRRARPVRRAPARARRGRAGGRLRRRRARRAGARVRRRPRRRRPATSRRSPQPCASCSTTRRARRRRAPARSGRATS